VPDREVVCCDEHGLARFDVLRRLAVDQARAAP
jgi:hypothetical protein